MPDYALPYLIPQIPTRPDRRRSPGARPIPGRDYAVRNGEGKSTSGGKPRSLLSLGRNSKESGHSRRRGHHFFKAALIQNVILNFIYFQISRNALVRLSQDGRETTAIGHDLIEEKDTHPKEKRMTENATNLAHEDKAYKEARERMERLIFASLCANCIHQQDCAYLAGTASPIQHCEMYVCGPSARPRLSLVQRGDGDAAYEVHEAAPSLGLCVNCENRGTCTLPKPLGGVWHCEEFC